VPLIINIGSGLALLGVATVVADFLALYVLPGKKFYNQVKYELAEVPKEEVKPIPRELGLRINEEEGGIIIENEKKDESKPLLDRMKF